MDNPVQKVTRLISEACCRYPGGMAAVFQAIQARGGKRRARPTFYADFNPNESSCGNLKVADFMAAMEVTGEHDALRYMANRLGYALISLSSVEPDAPTVEGEMLQDYPAIVALHEVIKQYHEGKGDLIVVLSKLDAACTELKETVKKAVES